MNLSTPKISVIMPVFNGKEYLKEAIESVLSQSYGNFELIIINDGSTDNSESIIKTFSDLRIRYIKNESNIKLIKTLNKGIALAKGEYIARMDADDVCERKRFEKQLRFLEKNNAIDICGSWAKTIDGKGEFIGRIKQACKDEDIKAGLLFSCPLIHPTIMAKADLLKTFPFDEEAIHGEDFELWTRIAATQNYRFANIPEYLLKYRWHSTNISVQNEQIQLYLKKSIIKKSLFGLVGEASQKELDMHLISYSLYRFGEKCKIEKEKLMEGKNWLEKLSLKNYEKKLFSSMAFDSLLWSRWIVICFFSGEYKNICAIKLSQPKLKIAWHTFNLLLSK